MSWAQCGAFVPHGPYLVFKFVKGEILVQGFAKLETAEKAARESAVEYLGARYVVVKIESVFDAITYPRKNGEPVTFGGEPIFKGET